VGGLRYELLREEDVTDEVRALVGGLLEECFGDRGAGKRTWVHHPPTYRALVWDGDVLVGNEMGCVLECIPPIALYGVGDLAVRPAWRGCGIAKSLGHMTHDEGIRRGADAILCSTVELGPYTVLNGWDPVQPGELFLRRRHRRDLRLYRDWYVKWLGPKTVPLRIDSLF
jgi:GNAT superfamily N-acetyltransferase